jgi:membrane fusion protein, multidrug efflux system
MQIRIWTLCIVSASALWLSACSRKTVAASAAETPGFPVKIATAESRTIPVEVKVVGNVEPYSTISVKSQVTGALDKVNFKEGDFVRDGALLFEIDPRPFQEAIHQIEATLARDTALLRQAEANLDRDKAAAEFTATQANRIRRLAKEGVFSVEQLDQAEADLKSRQSVIRADQAAIESSRAAVAADEASISNAKLNLSYTRIHAPVNGRTGNLMLKRGNLIKANDVELVVIHQIEPIYVTFAVPEARLPEIRRRMQSSKLRVLALIEDVQPDQEEGTVSFMDNAVDPATGTIRMKGTFDNRSRKLWPGQFVNVRLRLSELPNATIIPPQALQVGQKGEYVYVVKADNTVDQRIVSVSVRDQSFLAIADGLRPGEKVVTDGQVRLTQGSKVRVGS